MSEQKISYSRYADIKRLKFIEEQLAEHQVESNASILDVGCGNGIISMHLGRLGYNVLGVELSEDALEVAKKNNDLKNVEFRKENAENLKIEGLSFDVVICSEVLEHLFEPENLLYPLHSLLKDSGIFIATVPNGVGPRELLVTRPYISLRKVPALLKLTDGVKNALGYKGTTIQSSASDLDHVQFFTRKQLRKLAKATNFRIILFKASNFIDDVFPFSLVGRKSLKLQKADAKLADALPVGMSGGYLMVWKKVIAS
ncbi:MAG: methyltransferase domain-containing protein [Bacteroidota bacterium]